VDTIDDNTMLFVIGDHGMTSTGKLEYYTVSITATSVCAHCSSVTLYCGFFCITQNMKVRQMLCMWKKGMASHLFQLLLIWTTHEIYFNITGDDLFCDLHHSYKL
jgi:hypothetical protein